MGTKSLDIMIIALLGVLLIAQIALAIKQIKKKAPDGKILLIIDIVVAVIFTPLSVVKLMFDITAINIVWFVIAAVYMIFTIWYSKQLQKTMQN